MLSTSICYYASYRVCLPTLCCCYRVSAAVPPGYTLLLLFRSCRPAVLRMGMCCSIKCGKLNCTYTVQYSSSFCSVVSFFVLYECRKTSARKHSLQSNARKHPLKMRENLHTNARKHSSQMWPFTQQSSKVTKSPPYYCIKYVWSLYFFKYCDDSISIRFIYPFFTKVTKKSRHLVRRPPCIKTAVLFLFCFTHRRNPPPLPPCLVERSCNQRHTQYSGRTNSVYSNQGVRILGDRAAQRRAVFSRSALTLCIAFRQ